jgi:hypothetical protein
MRWFNTCTSMKQFTAVLGVLKLADEEKQAPAVRACAPAHLYPDQKSASRSALRAQPGGKAKAAKPAKATEPEKKDAKQENAKAGMPAGDKGKGKEPKVKAEKKEQAAAAVRCALSTPRQSS